MDNKKTSTQGIAASSDYEEIKYADSPADVQKWMYMHRETFNKATAGVRGTFRVVRLDKVTSICKTNAVTTKTAPHTGGAKACLVLE